MRRSARAIGVLVAAMIAAAATPAAAEVLDAVYRGTLVCEKLPFTRTQMREAIDVTVSDGAARYVHVVRLRDKAAEPVPEQGAGTISGQNIELRGAWKDGTHQYEANYSGTFVRRSAQLKGTQTWSEAGKTMTRACSGAIKRPLKPFLPRSKSKPAGA